MTAHQQHTYLQTFATKTIAVLTVRVVVNVDVDALFIASAGGMQVAGTLDTSLALDAGLRGRVDVVGSFEHCARRCT
jgi:hypothetical protein